MHLDGILLIISSCSKISMRSYVQRRGRDYPQRRGCGSVEVDTKRMDDMQDISTAQLIGDKRMFRSW